MLSGNVLVKSFSILIYAHVFLLNQKISASIEGMHFIFLFFFAKPQNLDKNMQLKTWLVNCVDENTISFQKRGGYMRKQQCFNDTRVGIKIII